MMVDVRRQQGGFGSEVVVRGRGPRDLFTGDMRGLFDALNQGYSDGYKIKAVGWGWQPVGRTAGQRCRLAHPDRLSQRRRGGGVPLTSATGFLSKCQSGHASVRKQGHQRGHTSRRTTGVD
jgi:hypothetical protein